MLDKVWAAVVEHKLFRENDTVVLGVSGGPDSVALMHAMLQLRGRLGLTLHVAHLNHMLRGEEADADAVFVEDLARRMGLECTSDRIDVREAAKGQGLSLEEAARNIRYRFLHLVAETVGANCIAVGHHMDDQAETVLLHLLRGSGLKGMAGMKFKSGLVVRPLLETTRTEIESYCREQGLEYRLDASNRELDFTRNRIRHQLLPTLKEYNPNIVETLARAARVFADDNQYLDSETDRVFESVCRRREDGLSVSLDGFLSLHAALQRRVIRRCHCELANESRSLEFVHVEAVRKLAAEGNTGKVVVLPGNMIAERSYGDVVFKTAPGKEPGQWPQQTLAVPGRTAIAPIGKQMIVRVASLEEIPPGQVERAAPETAFMDMECLKLPLTVRPRWEGDWFRPLGCPGRKKVKDFLIDKKIPRVHRDAIPIVQDQEGIVWLPGFTIDERVKVTQTTRTVLCLALEQG